jgi:hypothetical protein
MCDGRGMAGELAGSLGSPGDISGDSTELSGSGCVRFWAVQPILGRFGSIGPGSENPRVGGSIPSLAIP